MARHSIQIARTLDGWTWELIDEDGVTALAGGARNQDKAMRDAWEAARAHNSPNTKDYPEITVGRGRELDLAA